MRRKLIVISLLGSVVLAAGLWLALPAGLAQREDPNVRQATVNPVLKPPGPSLPVTHVVLFSSGVGFFQREGEIDGDARVDLSFPSGDINDLMKSMVLQDLGGGRVSTVSYDSHDPIERTLKSFALDLTANPTLGQLLNQARGERVEAVMQQSNATQPGTLSGIIVGMETQQQPGKDGVHETECLNLLTAEGLRNLPLAQVQRVRFLNPVLDSELKRALETLARSRDTQKKTVSLTFAGEGKRNVRVGYVVENPIWKTSYRLVLDREGKPFLQGWAAVENPTDEDWSNVRMALVSGRPISFQMDLYQPLYVPRPTVEPELFASLRPQAYGGDMSGPQNALTRGSVPAEAAEERLEAIPGSNRFQPGFAGRQAGLAGGGGFGGGVTFGLATSPAQLQKRGRVSFENYKERKGQMNAGDHLDANVVGLTPAGTVTSDLDMGIRRSVASVANAQEIGNFFQYLIDHKVTLPRQKSAMLPIVNQPVEGTKVSIYNQAVHAKFPLHGLRFKNTSGLHLMQGPVTVFEGNSYAGDARVMDLQPNEERLLSYAVDLGMEVEPVAKTDPDQIIAVRIFKGIIHATHKQRMKQTYNVKNRSEHDRTLLIEQPFRSDWQLVSPEKPAERTREVYRFQVTVPAGKNAGQEVVEEQVRKQETVLSSADDMTVQFFLKSTVPGPKVKEALQQTLERKAKLAETQRELAELDRQLKAIADDQSRLRQNLEKVPPTSAAYKRYLEKFDTQETEIEKLQSQSKELRASHEQRLKDYETFVASLNVE